MDEQARHKFITVCSDFEQAMLVTKRPDGLLAGRPMAIAELEESGNLWFITSSESGKVEEILHDPAVCVTLADGADFAWITGHAEITRDTKKIDSLWKEQWKVWFPSGRADPNLTLIQLHAEQGEYWSQSGTNRFRVMFEAATAYLSGTTPKTDKSIHSKVDLR